LGRVCAVQSQSTTPVARPARIPSGARYAGSIWEAADTANEPTNSTPAPHSQASPTALSLTPRFGTCQAVFHAYWRALTRPSPVHRRPAKPSTDAALRLASAVRMASVMSSAVWELWSSWRFSMTSWPRSFDEEAEKNPSTAMPTSRRGRRERKADRVMAEAMLPPWSSL
jgi:hypothetical protein